MEIQINQNGINANPTDQNIEISGKIKQIAEIVYHFGHLRPHMLDSVQIEDWAYWIDRDFPDIDLNIIWEVLRKMRHSEYKYDNQMGIQNIILGIKKELIVQRNNGKTLIV